jgi:hypothetical protein
MQGTPQFASCPAKFVRDMSRKLPSPEHQHVKPDFALTYLSFNFTSGVFVMPSDTPKYRDEGAFCRQVWKHWVMDLTPVVL